MNNELEIARARGPVTAEELAAFVGTLSATLSAHFAAEYPGIDVNQREVVADQGPKRARIVSRCPLKDSSGRHVSQSAYCFVDLSNGDILKTASWTAPAKGPRGNIRVGGPDTWWNNALTPHGAAYRR